MFLTEYGSNLKYARFNILGSWVNVQAHICPAAFIKAKLWRNFRVHNLNNALFYDNIFYVLNLTY